MANKIQIRRGMFANLPTLSVGEPAFCTDTKQFFIGDGTTNINLSATNIGDRYSASKTYSVGEYCIYNNLLFKCTTAITVAEAWNATKWTLTTVSNELKLGAPTKKSMLWAGASVIPLTSLCYKIGDMVHVDFRLPINTPIVNGSVIGELPMDCKPLVSTGYISCGVAYGSVPLDSTSRSFAVLCSVQANGQITIASETGAVMYNSTVSFEFFVK